MNVNSRSTKSAKVVSSKRVRRTPEAAKALILNTAAARLKDHGLEGLNLTGVAEAAGISHATIIHHFGSSEEMRRALVHHMTAALLTDVITALQREVPPVDLCENLFRTIVENGHARLLAWLAVDNGNQLASPEPGIQTLFAAVIETVANDLHREHANNTDTHHASACPEELEHARNIVMLVSSTAIGLGVAGAELGALLGMNDSEQAAFPRWLARLVTGPTDALGP